MNDITHRELRIIEILSETFKLFKSSLRLIVPLCLLALIPVNLIELFFPQDVFLAALLTDPVGVVYSGLYNNSILFFGVTQVIRLIFTCLVTGGYTYLAMRRFIPDGGTQASLSGFIDFVMGKWISIAFTGILFYCILSLSAIMIFPAVYFAVIFIFHLNIAAVSGERGFKALIASARLVRGRFLKRMFYGITFLIMQFALAGVLARLTGGLYPPVGAELTLPGGILILALNVLTETIGSIFIMAQAVWFVNILLSRKTQQEGVS
ncbi:MAG: hypothetical protein FWE91_00075 [Defluviitaleaceae bacterium]|nr:hypothetical protein [Defluviitaleaceae bacterium]MCL2836482.1 hypothetical protein [Defluviitaleaceae bacterium]